MIHHFEKDMTLNIKNESAREEGKQPCMKGRRIVAVHGIRYKGQAIPARYLDTALERMSDWQRRHTT